eukprot:m.53954 g.53954  ORF g.53954 m.53954 type:complete len:87 (+) comp34295_c0_seq1:264-524(+)
MGLVVEEIPWTGKVTVFLVRSACCSIDYVDFTLVESLEKFHSILCCSIGENENLTASVAFQVKRPAPFSMLLLVLAVTPASDVEFS